MALLVGGLEFLCLRCIGVGQVKQRGRPQGKVPASSSLGSVVDRLLRTKDRHRTEVRLIFQHKALHLSGINIDFAFV